MKKQIPIKIKIPSTADSTGVAKKFPVKGPLQIQRVIFHYTASLAVNNDMFKFGIASKDLSGTHPNIHKGGVIDMDMKKVTLSTNGAFIKNQRAVLEMYDYPIPHGQELWAFMYQETTGAAAFYGSAILDYKK